MKKWMGWLKWQKITRILVMLAVAVILLALSLFVAINIPYVQTLLAGKIVSEIRKNTGTGLTLQSVKIAFPNTVRIREVYIQDKSRDTLLYLKSLKANIGLWKILQNQVLISSLELEDVVVHLARKTGEEGFNYQFFLDQFSRESKRTDSTDKPKKEWIIDITEIAFNKCHFTFIDHKSGVDVEVVLDEFRATTDNLDFSKRLLEIRKLILKEADVRIAWSNRGVIREAEVAVNKAMETKSILVSDSNRAVVFPNWTITADQLLIENSGLRYDNNNAPRKSEGIDYNHIALRSLQGDLNDIHLSKDGISANLKSVNLEESRGFFLKKLKAEVQYMHKVSSVRNLQIATQNSEISGSLKLEYASLDQLAKDFANSSVSLDINKMKLNKDDILLFVPDLAKNPFFQKIDSSVFITNAVISGKINDLNIENLELSLLRQTSLKTHGRIKGLPDYKKIEFDLSVDQFSSCKADFFQFVDPAKFSGFRFPETFSLTGTATGNSGSFSASTSLMTSFGDLSANLWYYDRGNALEDSFKIDFDAKKILVGTIIGDSLVGKVSVSGEAAGKGMILGPFSCSAGFSIREAEYMSYKYSGIQIDSRVINKKVNASASSGDPNLKFKFAVDADLNKTGKQFEAHMELDMLNLNALNFTKSRLAVRTSLAASVEYIDSVSFKADLEFRNTNLFKDGKTFPVKVLSMEALSTPENFKAQIKSDIADGVLSGNVKPLEIRDLFQYAYRKYLGQPVSSEPEKGRSLSFRADFFPQQNILQQIFPGLVTLKVKKLEGTYQSDNNEFAVNLEVPGAAYRKIGVDSLLVAVNGKNDALSINLGLHKIYYDSLEINNLSVVGQLKQGIIHSEIKIADPNGTPSYFFSNEIEIYDDGYKIRFLPGGLFLDGRAWDTSGDNFFQKRKGMITTLNFNGKNKQESIEFFAEEKVRKFVFSNFEIKNLANIVDYKGRKNIINGLADGEFGLDESGDIPVVHAGFAINQLSVLDSVVGNLSCKLSTRDDRLDIDTKLENNQNSLVLKGNVMHIASEPALDLKAVILINSLSPLEKFSFGQLSRLSGKLEGEATIKGTQQKPDINGYLDFENTIFKINTINFIAKLNDEKINISSKGFHFKDFVIEDSQSKNLTINGDILTDYKNNYTCDLHVVTKDFQPVNSTSADNPRFFGNLALDSDIKLSGDLRSPKIEADVKINGSTNLTYALPGSELKLVTSEGIVNFRDASHLNDSLLLEKQGDYLADSIISKLSGIDLSMNLEIDPDAKFRVDIDPKSGDYLAISGTSRLNISMDVSGKQSMTGIYEVKSGNYQLSFYGMVKKNFTILPGSTVTWSGRPMDAEVNITAEYVVRTSSVALVANETSGMSDTEKNVFKTRLPYEVRLIIRGFPSKPDVKFELALPDKYLMTYPVVASKVALLNTEEKASELNKQVFALLVTGGFIADNPMASTDGSSPASVASTAARNSVNGILADQLNNISGKYINNIDVNFGLTSYEDYAQGSSDTRTELDVQLSKKIWNDRLTVEAQGSFDLSGDKKNTGTSTEKSTGEVGVVYQLTKSNEYKLRIYYQNIYDLFEGELTCSGIALIFEKEFDTLKKTKKQKENSNLIKQ